MLRSFNRATLAVLAGVTGSIFVAALPASAQETDVIVRGTLLPGAKLQRVSYRDLNLNLIAHRKILDLRVARAVRKVCDSKDLLDERAPGFRACADAAWAGARPQITRAYVRAAQLAYYRR